MDKVPFSGSEDTPLNFHATICTKVRNFPRDKMLWTKLLDTQNLLINATEKKSMKKKIDNKENKVPFKRQVLPSSLPHSLVC